MNTSVTGGHVFCSMQSKATPALKKSFHRLCFIHELNMTGKQCINNFWKALPKVTWIIVSLYFLYLDSLINLAMYNKNVVGSLTNCFCSSFLSLLSVQTSIATQKYSHLET